MTKPDIWMPWYPSDYLRDTRHLTCLEHGAYRQLIDAVFCADGAFSVTDDDLPRMLSISEEDWNKISKRIRAFFQIKDGIDGEPSIWKHKRVTEEIRKANENKRLWQARTEAARLSLQRKRKSVTKTVTGTVTEIVTTSSSPSPSPSPSLEREKGDASIPTWEEVQTEASMRCISPETAKSFFDHHEDNNLWINDHQRLINWRSKLRNWKVRGQTIFAPPRRQATDEEHAQGF